MGLAEPALAALTATLEQARDLGFLGPGPVQDHVVHAEGFLLAAEGPARRVLDLGSGGGVPGLIVALAWTEATVVLVDSNRRRTDFLERAVDRLGIGARVRVERERAESLGRRQHWRQSMELVVSRSFGLPAVVSECAAPFLVVGGRLIVSEPPEQRPGRWPEAGLEPLGLRPEAMAVHTGHSYQVLRQVEPCPERYPRQTGVPAKRPLF